MKRQEVKTTPVLLRSTTQVEYLLRTIPNLPLDSDHPIEVLIREQVKKRKPTLNARMWAGPLKDISDQVWIGGRQYSPEVWHEHFKESYLPDPDSPEFDPSHVTDPETYRKWDINPWNGNRQLVGSTTQLTDRGMRIYLMQMEAEGAQHGVQFSDPMPEPLGRPM